VRHLAVLVVVGACAGPIEIDRASVLPQLAARYPAFFPDGAGLLQPRFGAPAVIRAGDGFAVELLRRAGQPPPRAALLAPGFAGDIAGCLAGTPVAGCWTLGLVEQRRERVDANTTAVTLTARADGAPPTGGYDLAVDGARAANAVWLRADDPDAVHPLHVVQISDLHVGKRPGELEPRLRHVIAEVNALAPDLVVVTGDLVETGEVASEAARAAEILRGVDAPVLTVMGGHDVGISVAARRRARYGAGWENNARVFHPLLMPTLRLGGWDFIGFDTGPNAGMFSIDRGISRPTAARLGAALADARAAGRRGVVLLSHAPTRASVRDDRGLGRGCCGRMRWGGAELERVLLDAAAVGQRVVHLTGHTHWSDVFVADHHRFVHWWPATSPCWRAIDAPVALITTQSASQAGFRWKRSARGFGYAELALDDHVYLAHHQLGAPGCHP